MVAVVLSGVGCCWLGLVFVEGFCDVELLAGVGLVAACFVLALLLLVVVGLGCCCAGCAGLFWLVVAEFVCTMGAAPRNKKRI